MATKKRNKGYIWLEITKSNGTKEKLKIATFLGAGDAAISAKALQAAAPKNFRYYLTY